LRGAAISVSRNTAPAAAKHLLLVGFSRADWPTVWGSVQVCCGIFFFIILGTGKRETVEEWEREGAQGRRRSRVWKEEE